MSASKPNPLVTLCMSEHLVVQFCFLCDHNSSGLPERSCVIVTLLLHTSSTIAH